MPPTVSDYYHTLESRLGYRLVLGGTRHFGYYEEGTLWPFPLSSALRRMEERLCQTLGLKDNALVLDAGTGTGDVAIYMSKKGLIIKGIDLVDMHVQWARANVRRKRLEGQVEVSNGSYEKLDFDNASFDGVYTMETLVHADDPDQAMREFYRVLKPSEVVTHFKYEHDMESNPAGRRAMRRINIYTSMPDFEQFPVGTIQKKLKQAGLCDIEVQDLTQNVAPIMRFFFLLAYISYLIIQLLGLEAHFVNAMAGVELWRHGDNIRYLAFKARKPPQEPSASDELRRRLTETDAT